MNAIVKRWLPLGIIWVAAVVSGVIFIVGRDDDSSPAAAAAAPPSTPQSRLVPNGSSPPQADGSDAFQELVQCLSDHGVELSPGSGRPSLDDADVRAAFDVCAQYLPGRRDGSRGFRFGPPGGFDGTPPDGPSQDGGSGSDV
jgi:hypothetical protein